MRQQQTAKSLIKTVKVKTRKLYSTEEKIRVVIEGIRGEYTIAELCRKEGITDSTYYKWTKDFMEAGKKRLSGDTLREANTTEVNELKQESLIVSKATSFDGNYPSKDLNFLYYSEQELKEKIKKLEQEKYKLEQEKDNLNGTTLFNMDLSNVTRELVGL